MFLEVIVVIFLGLLIKGGIFVFGLWLFLIYFELESLVLVILLGVVVKVGVFLLVCCVLIVEEIELIVRFFGIGMVFLGVSFVILEKDIKCMLVFYIIF